MTATRTFSVPQQYLGTLTRYRASGTLQVRAVPPGIDEKPEEGMLTFMDNMVDASTGTLKLKGTFPNAGNKLWPGEFVRVTLRLTTQRGAVVVPNEAIQTGLDYGQKLGRFAWTPNQPGSRIMRSVIPFVAVAVAGFALLALFVLRFMRRTAAAIAAGEDRLRHLAMHDPLCGLPNRAYFADRLDAVIGEVRAGSAPAGSPASRRTAAGTGPA